MSENNEGSIDENEINHNDDLGSSNNWKKTSFNEKLEATVKMTKGEILVMLLTFALRHQISDVAIVDLVAMLNVILGNQLPKTLYSMYNVLNPQYLQSISHHYFCTKCYNYVSSGRLSVNEKVAICDFCKSTVNVSNPQKENSFISVDLKSQIAQILDTSKGLQKKLMSGASASNLNIIHDITDGRLYKKLKAANNMQHILTYNFCLDGMATFRNSKGSVWPIFAIINELPLEERNDHMLLAGLWFGKNEPKFEVFLKPFTDQAAILAKSGMNVTLQGKKINVKVFPACCCADSVARPLLQNSTQFNGFYGCCWCLHPGFTVDGTVKYPIRNTVVYEDREQEETARLMVEAVKAERSIKGIKGPSPLITMPEFNIVQGFSPDSMHGIFLGVTKKIVSEWFDSKNSNKEFYIGNPARVRMVNECMSSVVMPQNVGRLPRPINERKVYKASEWRNFLLYMCIPCLSGILPNTYIIHISYLIGAVFLLLQETISMEDLKNVDHYLLRFVAESQELYGEAAMSYNMHSLLHVTRSVLDWGPIWVRSMFVYEGHNAILRKYNKGTTGIKSQLARRFLLETEMKSAAVLKLCSATVVSYISELHSQLKCKEALKIGEITFFGKSSASNSAVTLHEYEASNLLQNCGDLMFFNKIVYKGKVYKVLKSGEDLNKNAESVIYTTDEKIGCIAAIGLNFAQEIFIFFNEYGKGTLLSKNINCAFICNDVVSKKIIPVQRIGGKCVEIPKDNHKILIKVVNNFENAT